jgi:ankyrin repeat protein
VSSLIDAGYGVNSLDEEGQTPLCLAADIGHFSVVDVLLNRSANPDARCLSSSETALLIAALRGRVGIVRRLIRGGANLNLQNDVGATALLRALLNKNSVMVKTLLDAGADPNLGPGTASPLHFAIRLTGMADFVQALVDHGADVEVKLLGDTPLLIAVKLGRVDMARALVMGGASVDAIDADGYDVFRVAVAVPEAGVEMLTFLKAAGAWTHLTDGLNRTVLHVAVVNGDVEKVRALLDMRAVDVNKESNDGLTALDCALRGNLTRELVPLLIAAGADVRAEDTRTTDILARSDGNDDPDVMRMLIEAGAKLDTRTLQASVVHRKPGLVAYLLGIGDWPEDDVARAIAFLSGAAAEAEL